MADQYVTGHLAWMFRMQSWACLVHVCTQHFLHFRCVVFWGTKKMMNFLWTCLMQYIMQRLPDSLCPVCDYDPTLRFALLWQDLNLEQDTRTYTIFTITHLTGKVGARVAVPFCWWHCFRSSLFLVLFCPIFLALL